MLLTKRDEADGDRDEHGTDDIAPTSEEEDIDGQSSTEEQSPDTDEVTGTKLAKSKKTLKRKRRATEPSHFGATLNALLNTDAPSSLPLSLKPSVARKRNDEKLEQKERQVLQVERKEKEDKGRVQDVIGGWGGEGERALRKVAQRGVVQLFNVIQQSQSAATTASEKLKSSRGTGKASLPAPSFDKHGVKKKGKHKGGGKLDHGSEATLGQDDFMDIIRSGVNVRV